MAAPSPDMTNIRIYAIGGGGFTHADTAPEGDLILEERLLALAPKMPKIGYVGHANGDNPDRIKAFYSRFSGHAETSHLPHDADAAAAKGFAAGLDIIYVGGGSTKQMLHRWHKTGLDDVFSEAGRRGVILAGVSAGAICWFSELLLGTVDDGFELLPGLGLVAGSACPHYDSEPVRRAAYDDAIAAGKLSPGLAIDDGVAVYIVAGCIREIIRARQGQAVFVGAEQNGTTGPVVLKPGFDLGGGAAARAFMGHGNRAR